MRGAPRQVRRVSSVCQDLSAYRPAVSDFHPIPPGPNVGTQLAALRRARKRRRAASVTASPASPQSTAESSCSPATGTQAPATDAETWFAAQGWQPFAFQREVWAHMTAGRSGLLPAPTGPG